jgi:hypothetical protein
LAQSLHQPHGTDEAGTSVTVVVNPANEIASEQVARASIWVVAQSTCTVIA